MSTEAIPANRALAGKVVLISGASSGIGKATARQYAQAGASVALVARRIDLLKDIVAQIRAEGGSADAFGADVADEQQAVAAVRWAEEVFGRVDILINNAGIIRPGPIATSESQGWRDTFDVNLLAPMYLSQAVLPAMQERGDGHIVMISSNAARIAPSAGNAAYAVSKYGINVLSAALRKEVAASGVRVSVIDPGTTATDIADSIPDEALRQQMDQHLHREGVMEADDIAAAILYATGQPKRVNVDEIWLTPTY